MLAGLSGKYHIILAQEEIPFEYQCGCWVSWDGSDSPQIAWYAIYVGNSPGRYTRKVLVDATKRMHLIDSLSVNKKYYLAMTAINYNCIESNYSNEVMFWRNTYNCADINGDTKVNNRDRELFFREYYKYNPKKSLWKKILFWIN